MGDEIHARRNKSGELRFRIWSTITDSYTTFEGTEAELRELTLEEAINDAKEKHLCEIDKRIKRAIKNGTSALGDTRNLNARWDRKLN